jgi:hypothetical protein
VTQYRLVFEGTDVARIKPAEDMSSAPLAWFRVVYGTAGSEVTAVHIYGHATAVKDRPWLAARTSITEAVAYCDELRPVSSEESYDWNGGSIESSPSD